MNTTYLALVTGITVVVHAGLLVGCGDGAALPDVATLAGSGSDAGGSPEDVPDTSNDSDAGSSGGDPRPSGTPIDAPPSTWSWIDVPEAVCDDGSPTGIGIWPSPTSNKLMFFFAGGGACWNYDTCVKNSSSAHGPFGAAEWAKTAPAVGGWIIGHGDTNPFKDWTTVFVPYCTGDLHAGDSVKTYTDGATSKAIHHKGRANVASYLARLRATYPSLEQVAVTGSSAGGGGALFSYPAIRDAWPSATGFMVDDSLPFFKDDMPLEMKKAWFENWDLGALTAPLCGESCVGDMSQVFSATAKKYPNDRMGLVSYTTDLVIAAYYKFPYFWLPPFPPVLLKPYWQSLRTLVNDVLDPLPNFKHYFVDTTGHVTLTQMDSYSVKGTRLTDWLSQMASGDPGWTSR